MQYSSRQDNVGIWMDTVVPSTGIDFTNNILVIFDKSLYKMDRELFRGESQLDLWSKAMPPALYRLEIKAPSLLQPHR